jgi:hypothetical protein
MEYQIDLGSSACGLGNVISARSRWSESLVGYDKAIDTLTPVYQQHPQLAKAKQLLRDSHVGRARAYDHLEIFTSAVKDWDRAIELSSRVEQPPFRLARNRSLFQAGRQWLRSPS